MFRSRSPRTSSVALALAALGGVATAGCSFPKPSQGTHIVTPDGGVKPVAHAQLKTRINHTDLLTVDFTFPSRSNENGASAGRFPAVVFLQDEGVAPSSYAWLTDVIASWGFVVATPHHVRNTPRFAPEDGSYTVDLLNSPPSGFLVGSVESTGLRLVGHGEGGRIGAKILGDRAYTRFALLGALPDKGDRARLQAFTKPWRAFAGTSDCEVLVGEIEAALGAEHVTRLEGVGHDQFAGEAPSAKCPPAASNEEARGLILEALRAFLIATPVTTTTDAGTTDAGATDTGVSEVGSDAGDAAGADAEIDGAAEADALAADGGAS